MVRGHVAADVLVFSRSLSVSSVSSVSSATSSSSSAHSVDSDDMYADLASPVSSASSRSPTPAQTKKEKGRGLCPLNVTAADGHTRALPQSGVCVLLPVHSARLVPPPGDGTQAAASLEQRP